MIMTQDALARAIRADPEVYRHHYILCPRCERCYDIHPVDEPLVCEDCGEVLVALVGGEDIWPSRNWEPDA